jgi:hypothetical protein
LQHFVRGCAAQHIASDQTLPCSSHELQLHDCHRRCMACLLLTCTHSDTARDSTGLRLSAAAKRSSPGAGGCSCTCSHQYQPSRRLARRMQRSQHPDCSTHEAVPLLACVDMAGRMLREALPRNADIAVDCPNSARCTAATSCSVATVSSMAGMDGCLMLQTPH